MTYRNQIIWLTGASSGIGEAVTYAFAREGAHLILSSRRKEELERVKANCPDPSKVMVVPLDVGDYKNIENKVKPVIEKLGRMDVLFNNAGISQRALAKDTKIEVYEKIMSVNFMGAVAMTLAVLPYMLRQKSGHIATVTSLTGKFGTQLRTGYAASKHALHGFFDSLRSEVWQDNINVTLICPGFVKTHISENALKGDGVPQNIMDDAIAHGLEPDYVAEKIVKGMKAGKEEIYIAGKEMMGVYLKRFFPGVFSRYIRKAKVT
ncbi:MAG TPA: SDR family oxidoreductase [Chitinophagales bacterium]|nr:SDR family oxidoreductase [Chitinophagales bacterium]